MIKIIHQFCKAARCQPADIVLEWNAKTGARLTATGPQGAKTSLNVLCTLNHMAQALLLAANGEEERYPQVLAQQKQLDAKVREWQAEMDHTPETVGTGGATPENKEAAAKDWRRARNPKEVLRSFPARPKADDLIDLYQLNKTLASPELADLLRNLSVGAGRKG